MTLTVPPSFTDAHRRALERLPEDGSWRDNPGKEFSPAVNSLGLYHRDLVEHDWGRIGPRGSYLTRWRLTPAGIELIKRAKG